MERALVRVRVGGAFFFLVILLFTLIPNRAASLLSYYVWEKYHINIGIVLNRYDVKYFKLLGNYYFANTHDDFDIEKSFRAYKKVSSLDPGDFLATYNLSRIYFSNGNLDEALVYIEKAIKLNPENKRPFYIKGLIETYKKDFKAAEKSFQRFIEWAPTEWAGYNDLAWVYLQDKKFIEAKKTTEEGIEKASKENILLHNNLGVANLHLGNYQLALREFLYVKEGYYTMPIKEWFDAFPGNSPEQVRIVSSEFEGLIYVNLYQTYKYLEMNEEADSALEKAQEIVPLYSSLRGLIDNTH